MIFRDVFAVFPICVQVDPSPRVQDLLLGDPAMVMPIGKGLELGRYSWATRTAFLLHNRLGTAPSLVYRSERDRCSCGR